MPGLLMWLRTTLSDPATWRDIAWLLVNAVVGFTLTLLSAVLFLASVFYLIYPFLVWVTPDGVFTEPFGGLFTVNVATSFLMIPFGFFAFLIWLAAGERLLKGAAYVGKSLLGPTESAQLAIRVRELSDSRAETVDTQAAELRRIERDLHDGAQARLAALSMNLGMAEEMVARDPAQAAALLTEARESASTALSELRDLVRGIHPPVLADRGLDGAVKALAMSLPFKVDVTIELPGRPPAPVESAAYFAVAEALANAVKHAAATTAWVQLTHENERLHILVGDDGVGGATVAARRRSVRYRTAAGRLRRYVDRGQPDRRADHRDHGVALRVVIAEDHALLRDGLIRLLEAHDFEVVEAVDNGPRLVPALVEHRPDVAVVDVRLPPTFTDEGLQAAIEARRQVPGLPVLVLSQYVEQLYARELLTGGGGAVGYLLKDRVSNVADFLDSVRRVAAGGTAMDPDVIGQLLARNTRDEPIGRLTPRESEVLGLMAEGRSNAAIASALFVTEKAVSKHTNNIFAKLDLPPSEDDNRRVMAVLQYLSAR